MKPTSLNTAGSSVTTAERPEVQVPAVPQAGVDVVKSGAGPRLAPHLSLEPVTWWERQCPSCNHSFQRNVATCPVDATPLKRVEVSLPFLWIG